MNEAGEAEFLAVYSSAAFAKPSVTVDVVLVGIYSEALSTVLVRRTEQPGLGKWALPGGFVGIDESLDTAAARVVREKARIERAFLEQLYTFGRPDRDPRMRIITVAYYALVEHTTLDALAVNENIGRFSIHPASAGDDCDAVDLIDERGTVVSTAFDHHAIVTLTVKRLRGKLNYAPLGYAFLPDHFTLLQLQRVHEIILGSRINKDSFRRRMLASGELVPTGGMEDSVDHRPAALYRRTSQGNDHG